MNQPLRGTVMNPRLVRLITRLHVAVYRLSGGLVGGLVSGVPNLLLTTTGRRSGKQFTTPLFYLPDGADFVVVASYGGSPVDPQWWKNLQYNGEGTVQVGPKRFRVQGSQAPDSVKDRMWPVFCRHYPGYDQYQASTDRVIPLVTLRPVDHVGAVGPAASPYPDK